MQDRLFNRDLGWLEFNTRVLAEALDERTPLLERVKFLSIFHSNLDEFFMKRVGGLKRQVSAGLASTVTTSSGSTPAELLASIREQALVLVRRQADCFSGTIQPALHAQGIQLLRWTELTDDERRRASEFFRINVFPILTPLAVDPGHPFPFISNLSTSLAVSLRHPERGDKLFARVKVPGNLPPWVSLSDGPDPRPRKFVSLHEVIVQHLSQLFPKMLVQDVMQFRVTRNADIERDEEDVEDLLEMIEEELRQRRFAQVVRLEHGPDPDPWMLKLLMDELELKDEDLYELPGLIDYTGLHTIHELPFPSLKYEPFTPAVPPRLATEESIFEVIRRGDLLIHHPYESFPASVERFIRTAADDPLVLAIKMTLYRTSQESPFIPVLMRAAEEGKHVVCIVELKARFDEERNIFWAQALEKAGVHVVYGIVGLKTHAKIVLVVRQDPEGLRSYSHIGTGNYHSQTARVYTDLGLFTCQPELTGDVVDLFHYLTGRSLKQDYRKLLVAPVDMKEKFLALIGREAEHARAGRPARIVAKMNNLEDQVMCSALYAAAQAGVEIDLIVRGFCCLKPGVPGLSERIRVVSVIGRFLEHSRVFYFRNGAPAPEHGDFFIGSADWMYRNLLARVEAVTPIEDPGLRKRVWTLLTALLEDRRQAWDMQADGTYRQRRPAPSEPGSGVQAWLLEAAKRGL